jgi:hypothetical protein
MPTKELYKVSSALFDQHSIQSYLTKSHKENMRAWICYDVFMYHSLWITPQTWKCCNFVHTNWLPPRKSLTQEVNLLQKFMKRISWKNLWTCWKLHAAIPTMRMKVSSSFGCDVLWHRRSSYHHHSHGLKISSNLCWVAIWLKNFWSVLNSSQCWVAIWLKNLRSVLKFKPMLGGHFITSHWMQIIQRTFGFVILGEKMGWSHQISRNSFAWNCHI